MHTDQQQFERILTDIAIQADKPTLLLHSCCAPCSTAVLTRLLPHFIVTIYFANPCIQPNEEFEKRLQTQKKLLAHPDFAAVSMLVEPVGDGAFLDAVKGLEQEPEGGKRCTVCFTQRLSLTADTAKRLGFDYFGTTLTVSPHKDAKRINSIGRALAEEKSVPYLVADFKKKDGYRQSVQLSKDYDLYRQHYCGCLFSKRQAEEMEERKRSDGDG